MANAAVCGTNSEETDAPGVGGNDWDPAPAGPSSSENERKSHQIASNFLLTLIKEKSRIAKRCGVTKSRQMLTNLQVFTVCLQTMTNNIAENRKN